MACECQFTDFLFSAPNLATAFADHSHPRLTVGIVSVHSGAPDAETCQLFGARRRLEIMSETFKFSVQYTNFPKVSATYSSLSRCLPICKQQSFQSPDESDPLYFALVSLGLERPIVCSWILDSTVFRHSFFPSRESFRFAMDVALRWRRQLKMRLSMRSRTSAPTTSRWLHRSRSALSPRATEDTRRRSFSMSATRVLESFPAPSLPFQLLIVQRNECH